MRILYFSSDNNSGSGAFRVLVRSVTELQEQGHDVLVILPYAGSGTKMLKDNNIKYKHIFTFSWIKHLKFNPWDYISHYLFKPVNYVTYHRELKLIDKYKPDICVINTCFTYVGALASIKKNIPFVWHIRELLEGQMGKTYYNEKYAMSLMNKANKVICVSKGVYDTYKGKIDDKRLTYIYEGLEISHYLDEDKEIFNDNKIHFVCAGRIKKQKGQYLIIEALNQIKDLDFDVVLVGDVRKHYKNKLIKMCEFKDRLTFTGQVKDVRPYYKKADLFLMPSFFEAFGLVTVEAILSGLFVIGSNMLGTKEILTSLDSNYQYLFTPGDSNSLKDRILLAVNNKEEIKKQAKVFQKNIQDLYSSKLNTEKIFKAYDKARKCD